MPEIPDPPDQAATGDGGDCMTPQQQRLESKGTTGLQRHPRGATRAAAERDSWFCCREPGPMKTTMER
jgi:hypothetical protein